MAERRNGLQSATLEGKSTSRIPLRRAFLSITLFSFFAWPKNCIEEGTLYTWMIMLLLNAHSIQLLAFVHRL